MHRLVLILGICTIVSLSIGAQQPAATPSAVDEVVRINTDLIQIDVTVTDKDGKVVTGLKPEDFQLYENGELQKIANFSFVSKTTGGASVGTDANTASNSTTSSAVRMIARSSVRRTIALVVDDLNLSFASVYYTRKALQKFVDEEMQPDDLVAVIHTGGGVGALQQFTSDKRLLKAAIASIRWNPFSSVNALSSVGQNDTDVTERFTVESDQIASGNSKQYTLLHPHDNIDEVQKASRDSAKNAAAAQKAIYAQSSIGAVTYIIKGMAKLPGRKAMLLFSDGINIGETMNNKSRAPAIFDFIQEVADAANRSSVTLFTFDARGMQQSQAFSASDNTYEVIDGHREQKLRERDRDFKDSQDGLVYLAEQTGGKALLNSNDLDGGIRRALDQQEGYYLLAYIPDAETFDANKRKFNKFEVKVKKPGLKVSYRSGFFSQPGIDVRPQLTAENEMAESLMSPFAQSDIALNINALYANDAVDGAYVRSFLHIDARSLKFSDAPDGWKTAAFDVAAVAFGNNGVPFDHIETNYTIKAKGPTFDAMEANGFVYVLMLPIKKPGVYQYRVALRDSATGKIGTASQVVEIPDLSKQRLTISSMAVEDVSMNAWQMITQGKVSNSTGQAQLQSTLLYDTVLRQFRPGTVLRYGFEVYNARLDPRKKVSLELQANILQNGEPVVRGNVNNFETADLSKSPRVSGAMTLRDDLKPGEYVFEITVTDTASKQITRQLFPFTLN
jgi:VWFA-related protein